MDRIKYQLCNLPTDLSFENTKQMLIQKMKSLIDRHCVKQYCIGKSFISAKIQSQRKFSTTDSTTWSKKGVKNRWYGKYQKEGYDEMVVVAVISTETLPEHRRSDEWKEQYTLSLEQELINHFRWSENDQRLANTNSDPGGKSTEDKEAYVLYIAIKFIESATEKSMGESLNLVESRSNEETPCNTLTASIISAATNFAIVEIKSVKALAMLIANGCKSIVSEELKQMLTQQTVRYLQLSVTSSGILTSFIDSTLYSLFELAFFSTTDESAAETSQVEEIVDKFITAQMSAVNTIRKAQLQGSEYYQQCCLVHEQAQRVVSEHFRPQITSMDNYKKFAQELSYQLKFVFSLADYISNAMKLA